MHRLQANTDSFHVNWCASKTAVYAPSAYHLVQVIKLDSLQENTAVCYTRLLALGVEELRLTADV